MESVLLTTSVSFPNDAIVDKYAAIKVDKFYLATGSAFAFWFNNANANSVLAVDSFRKLEFRALLPDAKRFNQSFEVRQIFCVDVFNYDAIKTTLNLDLPDMEFRNPVDQASKQSCDYFGIFILFSESRDRADIGKALQKIYDHVLPINRNMIGNVVSVVSTPFKSVSLFNSYSEGIICNVFGRSQCLFLIDVKLSRGCEGSPVFSVRNELLGMVMNVFTWYKGEWMGFSLAVHLYPVIKSWLSISSPKIYSAISDKYSFIGDRSVDSYGIVVVSTQFKLGSGVVINKEKGIVVTCSHVLDFSTETANVTVTYERKQFKGKILYATSKSFPFDLAVIKVDSFHLQNIVEFKPPKSAIKKGEAVYVIAYPLFSSRKHSVKGPSVTYGHVSNVYTNIMVLTTCASNSGASGGALVRPNGELLGIVANNVIVSTENLLIPHITVVIPSSAFLKPIERYCVAEDLNALNALTVKEKRICDIWQLKSTTEFVISKL